MSSWSSCGTTKTSPTSSIPRAAARAKKSGSSPTSRDRMACGPMLAPRRNPAPTSDGMPSRNTRAAWARASVSRQRCSHLVLGRAAVDPALHRELLGAPGRRRRRAPPRQAAAAARARRRGSPSMYSGRSRPRRCPASAVSGGTAWPPASTPAPAPPACGRPRRCRPCRRSRAPSPLCAGPAMSRCAQGDVARELAEEVRRGDGATPALAGVLQVGDVALERLLHRLRRAAAATVLAGGAGRARAPRRWPRRPVRRPRPCSVPSATTQAPVSVATSTSAAGSSVSTAQASTSPEHQPALGVGVRRPPPSSRCRR